MLHLRYTARDAGSAFRDTITTTVKTQLNSVALAESRKGLYRLFSARHEFPTSWAKFINPPAGSDQILTLETPPERFQFFTNGMALKARGLDIIAKTGDGSDYTLVITPPGGTPQTVTFSTDQTLNSPGITTVHHAGVSSTSTPPLSPVDLGRAPSPTGVAPPSWNIKLKKADAADFRSLTATDLDDLALIVSYEAS